MGPARPAVTAASLCPGYARLWSATALSNLGDGIRAAALPLLAAALTADPAQVAGVAVAGQVPWLLFGLPAGAVVDRVDRRRLVVAVDASRTALLAALVAAVALRHASLPLLYAVAFASGVGETARDTAASTMVPMVVHRAHLDRAHLDRAHLDRANGRLASAEIAGNELVGPPLGGYLFGLAGAGNGHRAADGLITRVAPAVAARPVVHPSSAEPDRRPVRSSTRVPAPCRRSARTVSPAA